MRCQNWRERSRGLLGKNYWQDNHGFWIDPCNSIHTLFMGFALTLIYVGGDNRVKKITATIKPWRFSCSLFSRSVVEFSATSNIPKKIQIGDTVQWCRQ